MKTAFLSSTANDLAEYRDAAYKAIEGMDDWHCVRMEDFGARDKMADEFCQEKVAECDVFVGIVGHCYGSSPKGSEKSYTEQEYDAAIATDKPRLMFLVPEGFPIPAYLIEPDEKRARQRALRDRVNAERIRDIFTSPENLAWRVVQAIRNWEWEQRVVEEERQAADRAGQIPQIFLCYAREDRQKVRQLYQDLRHAEFRPWLDQDDILPGQDWDYEIRQAIRKSDFFLACLSRKAVTKRGYVHKEIKEGLDVLDEMPEGVIYLIPVRLEDCEVPDRLRNRQWVDLFEQGGFEKLVKAVQKEMHSRRNRE